MSKCQATHYGTTYRNVPTGVLPSSRSAPSPNSIVYGVFFTKMCKSSK